MATDASTNVAAEGRTSRAAGSPALDARAAWELWRPSVLLALRAFAVTRAVVWIAGVGAVRFAGLSERATDFDPAGLTRPYGELGNLLVAPAARWDATWFLAIAHDGYADAARAAFFPLYPLLARGLLGGILVSAVAAVLALAALHRLARLELGERAATATVWLLACFPMAFFLSAVYSEALFLAVSVGAVLCARQGRWAWAGALGALGAATRSAGVLLVVPLALLWWRGSDRARRAGDLAWIALVPAGLGAFCAGLALEGLDPAAPFRAQEVWFRSFAGPFGGIPDGAVAAFEGARQLLSGSRTPVYFRAAGGDPFSVAGHNLVLFAFLLAAAPAVVGALRRLPPAYGVYALAALALPLSYPVGPQPLMSLPRFELVLFPLFMWLGWWAARGRRRLVVLGGAFLAGQAFAAAEFATWHWVA